MILYILIGIVFAMFIEYVRDSIISKYPALWPWKKSDDPFNMSLRFIIVVLWPFGLLTFAIGFYKSYFKK